MRGTVWIQGMAAADVSLAYAISAAGISVWLDAAPAQGRLSACPPNDAPLFTRLMPQFTQDDSQNRPNHEATAWIMHHGARLKPFTATMDAPHHRNGYQGR